MNELLQKLTEAVGVSGDENEVRVMIRDLITDLVDELRIDTIGNIIALRKGTGKSDLKILVDAHMDEIGFIITGIDSSGCLEFANVGGIDTRTLNGKLVQVGRKKVQGIIGLAPIHLIGGNERNKIPSRKALRIDIGAKDKANALGKVKVGDRATFLSEYEEMGEESIGRTAVGKALDNRAGCAALIELLKRDRYPFDLVATFSVQEEIGLRGTPVVGFSERPDAAIVLECTPAYDLPSEFDVSRNTSLGQGPALYVMDSQTIQDPRLVQHIIATGDKNKLPYQIRQPGGGGTNTGTLQRAGIGRPAATIGLPGRYAHTDVMMINLRDYENYVNLADAALRSLTRKVIDRS